MNDHRRHLNEAQRGMEGAKLANLQVGGSRGNQHTGGKSAIALLPRPIYQKEAAEMLNVGVAHRDATWEQGGFAGDREGENGGQPKG